MTARDKKLLIFLIIFVIVVAFVALIGLPQGEALLLQREAIAAEMLTQQEIQRKAMNLDVMAGKLQESEGALAELREHFFPLLQNQEISNRFTHMATDKGLTVHNLTMGSMTTPATLSPYMNDEVIEESSNENIIYQTTVTLKLTGAAADLQAFVDEVFAIPGVLVNSWKATDQQIGADAYHLYEVNVTVYMVTDMVALTIDAGM